MKNITQHELKDLLFKEYDYLKLESDNEEKTRKLVNNKTKEELKRLKEKPEVKKIKKKLEKVEETIKTLKIQLILQGIKLRQNICGNGFHLSLGDKNNAINKIKEKGKERLKQEKQKQIAKIIKLTNLY